MYKIIFRPILFMFNPETIHGAIVIVLKMVRYIPGLRLLLRKFSTVKSDVLQKEVFGLRFTNPIGIAAGFDKNAEVFDILGDIGFSFIEIGTVTPKAQPGNDKPRIFRLPNDKALINRMGFNNHGVEHFIKNIKQKKSNIIVCGNIGKNKLTPNSEAINDYAILFEQLFPYVHYFTVNVSSPNTPNLRELQDKEPLKKLLTHLMQLNNNKPNPKPLLLKIAPDLTESQLDDVIEIFHETKISGIVATNTTIARDNLSYTENQITAIGAGGLSGKPLAKKSTEIIRYLYTKSNGTIPIIGAGGIFTADDAIEKLEAGAVLLQVYTGFIYEGPMMAKRINKKLISYLKNKL